MHNTVKNIGENIPKSVDYNVSENFRGEERNSVPPRENFRKHYSQDSYSKQARRNVSKGIGDLLQNLHTFFLLHKYLGTLREDT